MVKSLILSVCLAAAIVIGLARMIDFDLVWRTLLAADYGLVPAILLLRGVPVLARAWRFSVLLDRLDRLRDIYHAEAICFLVNSVLPLRGGEVAEIVLLRPLLGLSGSRIVAAMTLDRLLDIVFLALVLVALLPVLPGLPPMVGRGILAAAAVSGLACLALAIALRRRRSLGEWAGRLLRRLPRAKAEAWLARLDEGVSGVDLLGSPARCAVALLGTALTWGLAGAALHVTALAFGQHPDWLATTFAICLTMLGTAVISVPSGLGVMHAAIVVSYSLFGMADATALAVAVIYHAASTLVALGTGGVSLLRRGSYFHAMAVQVFRREPGAAAAGAAKAE